MIKVTEAQKKINAKLTPNKRLRLLHETMKQLPAKEIPRPPANGFSIRNGIDLFAKIVDSGRVIVGVTNFNEAEKRFVVDLCRALGFNPQW
jgi:hypothetical protein